MEKGKKILVVDDEEKITEVLKSYLEKEGHEAVCAHDGKNALAQYQEYRPDLVILDLMLPDISGEDICRHIRSSSNTPVIMLTAKVEEESILNGLNMGADDYVIKPFSPKQLIARVNAVLRRAQPSKVLDDILSFNHGDLVIDIEKLEVKKQGQSIGLTPNEYDILLHLAKHPRKVFTREELISFVLGEDYEGYDRTIDTHIKNLRQKLETNSKEPQYILTVYGVGYKFGGE